MESNIDKKKKKLPQDLESCLVKIRHQTCSGLSQWYEVCYYDPEMSKWKGYCGGTAFDDGEKVVGWVLCSELILTEFMDGAG